MSREANIESSAQVKLVISLDSGGQINVNGPINDRILCFGLLEMAKDAINAHAKQQQSNILVARPRVVV